MRRVCSDEESALRSKYHFPLCSRKSATGVRGVQAHSSHLRRCTRYSSPLPGDSRSPLPFLMLFEKMRSLVRSVEMLQMECCPTTPLNLKAWEGTVERPLKTDLHAERSQALVT